MPYRIKKLCAVKDCPALAAAGQTYCDTHKAVKDAEWKARSKEYDKKRNQYKIYDAEWRKFRKIYLLNHPYCQCGALATQVDHIIPISEGGSKYDETNLSPKCASCHSEKTAKENNGYKGKPFRR